MNKLILILILAILTNSAFAEETRALKSLVDGKRKVRDYQVVIIVVSACLLVLAAFIYVRSRTDPTTIEFTEFNSQYVGKESTRSDSEREFPNFDVDILKKPQLDESSSKGSSKGEQQSVESRRRRRKVDRIEKNTNKDNSLDMTPPPFDPMSDK